MIDRKFLFENNNFAIRYKVNTCMTYEKYELDLFEIINYIGKIDKLEFDEISEK